MADNGTFKIKYTELINEVDEIEGEMTVKTQDINWTLQRFMEGRHVIKVHCKKINN